MTEQASSGADEAPVDFEQTAEAVAPRAPSPFAAMARMAARPPEARLQYVTEQRPVSWLEIVKGEGDYTDAERATVMSRLKHNIAAVRKNYTKLIGHPKSGIMSTYELPTALEMPRLTVRDDKVVAFELFLGTWRGFHLLGDGRIVLTDLFVGDIADIPPLRPVQNIGSAIGNALVSLEQRPPFVASMVFAALVNNGYLVTPEIEAAVEEALSTIRGVRLHSNGLYTYARRQRDAEANKRRAARALDIALGAAGITKPQPK